MEILIISAFGTIAFFVIWYFIIRTAVRDGILKADQHRRSLDAEIALSKTQQDDKNCEESDNMKDLCRKCGKYYPVQYWPTCPLCGYKEE